MKTCSKCKEEKELTEYHKDKSRKDGVRCCCKICASYISNKYNNENKDQLNIKRREAYKINKEKIKHQKRLLYQKHKLKEHQRTRKYYVNNKKKCIETAIKRIYYRRDTEPMFKFKMDIRSMIGLMIRKNGYTKRSRTPEILGCSFEDFKIHIERQFAKGMSWDNRDKWHIDHIIPMATAKTEEDVIRLNHYTNLRPLWAEENLSKSDKIITHQLVLL